MKLPKIIIFDVGGTIVSGKWQSFMKGYEYLYNEVLNVKETYEEYIEFVSNFFDIINQRDKCDLEFNFISLLNYLVDLYGLKIDLDLYEIEYNFYKSYYEAALMPNIVLVLDYLKDKNIPLYVLSNSMYSTNAVKKELSDVGVLGYFEQVISSGDHVVRKPSSLLFKLYLKKFDMMGISKEEVCYIGNDLYFDINTPVSLNMQAILISDKYCKHEKYLEIDSYKTLLKEFKENE